VKRPVLKVVAVVGGPYPEAGADEAGLVAVCSLCGGSATANSVVRNGTGCVATTTRQRTPSGPTRISGQRSRLRTIWLYSPLLELIGRQVETRLDKRMIKHAVLFATGNIRKASHIGEHRPIPIVPIEPRASRVLVRADGSPDMGQ
jgi:hypothetical protein